MEMQSGVCLAWLAVSGFLGKTPPSHLVFGPAWALLLFLSRGLFRLCLLELVNLAVEVLG